MSAAKIQFTLFPDEKAIFAYALGSITFEQMSTFVFATRNDKNFDQSMNSCYDLTQCTNIGGDLLVLAQLAEVFNNHQFTPYYSRTSIIIPDNDDKLSRLVQGLVLMTSGSRIQHSIFRESQQQKAYQFVGFSEALQKQIAAQKKRWND